MREVVYEFALENDMASVYRYYNEKHGSLPSLDVPRAYDVSLLKQTESCFMECVKLPCEKFTTDECPKGVGEIAVFCFFPCEVEKSYCSYDELKTFSDGELYYEKCNYLLETEEGWNSGVKDRIYDFAYKKDLANVFEYFNDMHDKRDYDESLLKQEDDCLWDCQYFSCGDVIDEDSYLCPRGGYVEVCYDTCYP